MIIGRRSLHDINHNISDLKGYCERLIPPLYRGNIKILNNQKFYVALHVRNMKGLTYEKRTSLCNDLLESVYITGDVSSIKEIESIESLVDINKLMYNLYKEEINAYR